MKGILQLSVLAFLLGYSPGADAQSKAAVKTPTPAAPGQKSLVVPVKAAIIAKAYGDSIVLRWAPGDPVTWIRNNTSGWRLMRIDVSVPGHPVRTELGLIQPMPEQQLLAGLDTTAERTKYLTIAWKMLYGRQYSTLRSAPKSFVQEVKGQHGAFVLRYSLAMMAADYYPPAADALGLRLVDRKVIPGGKYAYMLVAMGGGERLRSDSVSVFVVNEKPRIEPVPAGLEVYGYDRKVEIRWQRRQNGNFSGYIVERSDDGGREWRPLTKTPYNSTYIPPTGDRKRDSILGLGRNNVLRDQQLYDDSIPQNYKAYSYRLRAINAFGEWSPYTEQLVIRGRDLSPPGAPVIDSARNTAGRQVKVWWTQRKTSADLAGYFVNRGATAKGPFHLLTPVMLDKHITSFVDTAAVEHEGNFYIVIAVDTARNVSASAPSYAYLVDSVAPSAPAGLTGQVDSNGVVRLRWQANQEADLLGYQVYFSYDSNYRFSQVTKRVIHEAFFTDTIAMNALDRKIYYKIVALDKNDNHSAFSAAAELRKPVLIPPTAPVAGKIEVNGKQVDIEWVQSRGDGVLGYDIYRKGPDSQWVRAGHIPQDWSRQSAHFVDSIQYNTDYYYAAETIDSSGLRSGRSFAVHVRSRSVDTVGAPVGLRAQWDVGRHSVALSWNYLGDGDYFFVVYRGVGGGVMQAWHSFEKDVSVGSDGDVKKGSYRYAISVVRRDRQGVSIQGQPVQVNIN
jgi:fibronectin type 3 domain-containing protein